MRYASKHKSSIYKLIVQYYVNINLRTNVWASMENRDFNHRNGVMLHYEKMIYISNNKSDSDLIHLIIENNVTV